MNCYQRFKNGRIKVMSLQYLIDGEEKFLVLMIFQKDGMVKMQYQENILGRLLL